MRNCKGPKLPSSAKACPQPPGLHLRWGYGSVSLLPRCVPDLSLYCLPIHLDAPRCKLHSNGAFAFQVKLIASESRQKVALAYSRVSNKYNCKTKIISDSDSRCRWHIENQTQEIFLLKNEAWRKRMATAPSLSWICCPSLNISGKPELPHSPASWTDVRLDFWWLYFSLLCTVWNNIPLLGTTYMVVTANIGDQLCFLK